ncbi:MAG: HdeD family acid-resistance protein [Polyangiaceae bacterium]
MGLAFGAAALLLPIITLTALILLFGAYLLADGIAALVAGLEHRVPAVLWLMEGIVGIGVGAAALIWPGPTTVVIVDLIAFWAIITGAIELSAAARIRKHLKGERSLAFAGLFSLALGTLMIVWPVLSAVAIITFLGCYAMFFGITMLVLAARVHKHHATPRETRRHLEHRTA